MAHVGQKALRAMERFVTLKTPHVKDNKSASKPPREWISQREWMKQGKPLYTERQLSTDPFHGFTYMYRVGQATSNQPPKFPNVLERAKWLWQHLPAEIRQHSQLLVTRENRKSAWSRSLANPTRHGWRKPHGKTSAGKPFYSNWLPKDYELEFTPILDNVIASFPEAPSPTPDSANVKASMLKKLQKARQTAGQASQTAQVPYKAHKPSPKLQKPQKAYGVGIVEEGPATSNGNAVEVGIPAPVAAKPKLRLGIWS